MSLDIEKFVAGLHDYLERALKPLAERIAALEKKQAAMRYRGVYAGRAEKYAEGNFITYDGSLWIALKDDPGKPGEGDGWQLCVKARDGR